MTGRARALAFIVVLGVLLLAVGGSVAAGAASGTVALQQANDTETENDGADDPEHVHPDEGGDDAEGETANWLEQRLGAMLSDSVIELDQGEYEIASEYVGEDYQERLEQYIDVQGETDGTTNEYEQAGQTQQELASLLADYEETLASYEAARDSGNETRARELARELAELSSEIEAAGVELEQTFTVLNGTSGTDLGGAADAVNGTVMTVREDTENITEETFVAVNLTVTADRERIAADDPLTIDGRLTDVNGTPISNATIAVPDPAGATTTTTDAEGRFSIVHRPVLLQANATSLRVEFQPETAAPYASADATIPVAVQQFTADLAINDEPGSSAENVAYGQNLSIEVMTTVDGEGLGGVPVRATIDGSQTTESSSNGSVTLNPAIDVTVGAGERTVRVATPFEGRAVTFEPNSTTVVVEETPTSLSVNATVNATGAVTVTGQLTTTNGPVSGAEIDLGVTGAPTTTTARTDETGEFSTIIESNAESESMTITAEFDGSNSNLQESDANTSATAITNDPDEAGTLLGLSSFQSMILLGVGVLLIAAVGWVLWQRSDSDNDDTDEAHQAVDTTEGEDLGGQDPGTVVDDARQHLDDDPIVATTQAYGAARASVADRVPVSGGQTHREFLKTCADDGLEADTVEALRTLTDRYEAAMYDPSGIDIDDARDAIDAAERVA
ncbi:DUF4129 domain-containing protein [Salinarchaeum laminariae]|uniref:DUF4129 domain-containing protein n=1 Tax=Salinarchaeum laminariae TaxID=869888 RepID=UPI0020BFF656|nr:DUF4129 domain-containing protein [Salinarchaeum laminariae]